MIQEDLMKGLDDPKKSSGRAILMAYCMVLEPYIQSLSVTLASTRQYQP